MHALRIRGVSVYPIKSCAPVAMRSARVRPRGLAFDRRFMLVDGAGRTITGREVPSLLQVQPAIAEEGLRLRAPDMPDLVVAGSGSGEPRPVFVFGDPCPARACGEEADRWFRRYLGRECRLVRMDTDCRRPVPAEVGGRRGDEVSFADECPLLLTSEASLADLNARLPRPVSMDRFRPNLVVRGAAAPYVEDHWRRVRIGGVEFDCAQACKRCVFTTIDPRTGVRDGNQEPLRTLSTYRRQGAGGPAFGIHLIPRGGGEVRPGDAVEITARG